MQKQPPMLNVVHALIPLCLAAVYFFGWRFVVVLALVTAAGITAEYLLARAYGMKLTSSVLVTCFLFALSLPPTLPFWMAVVGIVFGIVFGKMVFGGFGKNVFNPAAAARAFVYVSFAKYLTAQWSAPATQFMGGFLTYTTEPIDVLAQSTPMLIYREIGVLSSYFDLFFGNVSGSIGEVSAFLIILSGIYLLTKKVAHKETVFSVIIGFFLTSGTLYLLGLPQVPNPLWGLLAGGLLFGAVFMATDPITSPKTFEGRIVYGLLIGSITVIIRAFALFAGGIMFAILIANIFVPITDEAVKHLKKGV